MQVFARSTIFGNSGLYHHYTALTRMNARCATLFSSSKAS